MQQYEISRDLRRLLPLIRDVLPRPEIWEVNDDDFAAMLSEQLEDELALIDATEQRVSRPGKNNEIRKLFFSGKQHEFTLKTQQMVIGTLQQSVYLFLVQCTTKNAAINYKP